MRNYEKKVPMEWINEEGNDIKDELLTYLKTLIQGEVQIPYENGIPKRFILLKEQERIHAVQDSFYLSSYGMSGLLFLGFTGFFDDCEMK